MTSVPASTAAPIVDQTPTEHEVAESTTATMPAAPAIPEQYPSPPRLSPVITAAAAAQAPVCVADARRGASREVPSRAGMPRQEKSPTGEVKMAEEVPAPVSTEVPVV